MYTHTHKVAPRRVECLGRYTQLWKHYHYFFKNPNLRVNQYLWLSEPRSTNTYIITYFCTHNKSQGPATNLSYHLLVCLCLALPCSPHLTPYNLGNVRQSDWRKIIHLFLCTEGMSQIVYILLNWLIHVSTSVTQALLAPDLRWIKDYSAKSLCSHEENVMNFTTYSICFLTNNYLFKQNFDFHCFDSNIIFFPLHPKILKNTWQPYLLWTQHKARQCTKLLTSHKEYRKKWEPTIATLKETIKCQHSGCKSQPHYGHTPDLPHNTSDEPPHHLAVTPASPPRAPLHTHYTDIFISFVLYTLCLSDLTLHQGRRRPHITFTEIFLSGSTQEWEICLNVPDEISTKSTITSGWYKIELRILLTSPTWDF